MVDNRKMAMLYHWLCSGTGNKETLLVALRKMGEKIARKGELTPPTATPLWSACTLVHLQFCVHDGVLSFYLYTVADLENSKGGFWLVEIINYN